MARADGKEPHHTNRCENVLFRHLYLLILDLIFNLPPLRIGQAATLCLYLSADYWQVYIFIYFYQTSIWAAGPSLKCTKNPAAEPAARGGKSETKGAPSGISWFPRVADPYETAVEALDEGKGVGAVPSERIQVSVTSCIPSPRYRCYDEATRP
jgi:hypothetical protein